MTTLFPIIRISLAILVYITIAVLAATLIKKAGEDLKSMKSRISNITLIIGTASNFCVLGIILLFLILLDNRSINSLELGFNYEDLIFSAIALLIISTSSIVYIYWLSRKNNFIVRFHIPINSAKELVGLFEGAGVLLLVALQEETLFRGYLTLNLIYYGPAAVIIITTILFTIIHTITNKTSFYQYINWMLGGAVFSYVYLISGSIWVPIIIHFAADFINMFMFDIVGKYSLFSFSPPIIDRQRAEYKIIYIILLVISLISIYGTGINPVLG